MKMPTPAPALRRLSAILRAWTRLPDPASPAGCIAVSLAVALVGLLTSPAPAWAQTDIFDPDADYRILTFYGAATDIVLADYLANGVSGVTFSLQSCDASRSNYYPTAAVAGGKLTLTSNTLGHVHGPSTESETVCTVTGALGDDSESQQFELYTVSDRTPNSLADLSLEQARAAEVDIRITTRSSSGYVRLGWRKAGAQPTFGLVSGVASGSVLTIPSLDEGTQYEIRGYQLTRQSFDLYRAGNSGTGLQLIPEGQPAANWQRNLSGNGISKAVTLEVETLTEDPPPTVGIGDARVTEAAGAEAVFTVTLLGLSSRAVTVDYATADRTAEATSDYAATSGTLSIPAGSTTGVIRVPVLDDDIDEPEEHFTVILSSPTNASIDDGEGEGTIDDDEATPALRIGDAAVTEAPGAEAVFAVTLSGPSSRDVAVDYATADGDAKAASDYGTTNGTLIIPAGFTTGSIRVPILDDEIDEPDENFKVTLDSPSNATIDDEEGEAVIADDEATPALRIGDAAVTEAPGAEAVFTVTLSTQSSRDVSVGYQTSNGAAEAGLDYTETSGVLTILAGDRTGTIRAPVLDDDVDEPDEDFHVVLTNPANATLADDRGVGTITENDLPPTLSVGNARVTEAPGAEAVFTVTLLGLSSRAVTVDYATADRTAEATSDYAATSGTLSIPAGSTTGMIRVPVLDDDIDEPEEHFTVILSSPTNASIDDGEGEGTIDDDETVPSLTIGDVRVVERPGAEAVFTVTLSAQSSRDVTVGYQTSNGTAEAALDYAATSGVLIIPAGARMGTIRIPVLDDDVDEPDEDFSVVLANPANAALADDRGVGTITGKEPGTPPGPIGTPPTLDIGDAAVVEGPGAVAEFTVTLSAAATDAVTVDYATSDGSARADLDYAASSGTLAIPAGGTYGTIQVSVLDDTIREPDETFTVTLIRAANATIEDGDGTGTITDNDKPPALTIDDVTVTEGPGAVAEFTVTLSAAATDAVTVDYATSDGSARADLDYAASSGTLAIPAGGTYGTIQVSVLDDTIREPDETFTVTLIRAANATIEDGDGTGTITDNTKPPALTIDDVTVTEGPGAVAEFTVTLSAAATDAVTVDYATSDGSARADLDYAASSGTLAIPAGGTYGTIQVSVLDDTIREPDETFAVTLTRAANATIEDGDGTGTITDNDKPPALTIDDVTVTEGPGAVAEFTVTLSAAATDAVTVDYATSDGSARADLDYAASSGTLAIPAGGTYGTIQVSVLHDTIDEPDETFTVTLIRAANATIEDDDGTGTITDNDKPPALTIDDVTVIEGPGAVAEFTATLSAASGRTITVEYATADRTALAQLDYAASNGTLILPSGRTTGTVRVPVRDDALDELDETFTVTLRLPVNAMLKDDEGLGTIIDDDDPAVAVSYGATHFPVRESGEVVVDVVLSARPERHVVVPLTQLRGEGVAVADYAGVPATVSFGPSETRTTFTVVALEDTEYEGEEEVLLGFGSLPERVSAADPETAVLVIADVYVPDREKDDWLDPFGRTAAGHVLEALDDRMRCAPDRRPEETPAVETASASPSRLAGRWRCKPPYRPGASATAPIDRIGNSFGREEGELLAGSSFDARTETEDGGRLSVWGRGAFSRFDRHRGELALSGDVTTATLGTDYSSDRWMAGAALSHSRGEGIVSQGKFEAEARSDLSGLYPYARYGVREGLSIWGVAGHGRGTLTLSWKDAEPVDYRIATVMGAAGMNSELRSATDENDFALTLKADALFLRTFSERLPDGETSETDTTRFRLALEGSWDFTTEDEQWFSPFLEAGLRHDGGHVETRLGMEVGGGFRYAHPGLNLTTEMGARGLFTDESGAFEEWGVWGSLRYDPDPSSRNGASVEVSPSWGAANAGGVHALWQRDTMAGHAARGFDSHRGRIETELAYGLPVFGRSGTGTPLIGMSTSSGPKDYRVGYRLTIGSTLEVSVEAALRRNRRFDTPSTFGVLVHGALRW